MAETKIISEVFKIDSPISDVYSFFSDFNRIGVLFEMAKQMGMANSEQLATMADKVENVRFTEDTCFVILKGLGEIAVKIVEKESPKLIKLEGDGCLPFEFNLWVQLLENDSYDTRMRLTFQAELNVVMKMLLKGKLEKGMNQLGEGLSKIPFALLK